MMVLPASAQRWMVHHPVLPVMVLVAATIGTAQVGTPVLLTFVWIPALVAAGCYMGIEHSALRRHDPETCPRCDESVADRHASVLRRYHRLTRPVLVAGVVILGVLVFVAWGWRLTGLIVSPAAWIAYGLLRYVQSTHIRLQPWCPVVHDPDPARRHPPAGALTGAYGGLVTLVWDLVLGSLTGAVVVDMSVMVGVWSAARLRESRQQCSTCRHRAEDWPPRIE